jgi:hypothetical protein
MAELVDARDLKSRSRKGVWVRFPLEAQKHMATETVKKEQEQSFEYSKLVNKALTILRIAIGSGMFFAGIMGLASLDTNHALALEEVGFGLPELYEHARNLGLADIVTASLLLLIGVGVIITPQLLENMAAYDAEQAAKAKQDSQNKNNIGE